MGTIIPFLRSIPTICAEWFPDSPEFVAYLADRIMALQGSRELALIICRTLCAQCTSPSTVSAECVKRLGIDTDEVAVGRINHAHPIGANQIAVNTMVFLQQMDGCLQIPDRFTSLDELRIAPRHSGNYCLDTKIAYVRLFSCASAMLAGVTIDPRTQAA